jgi:hypothetical protein
MCGDCENVFLPNGVVDPKAKENQSGGRKGGAPVTFEEVQYLWLKFNEYSNKLTSTLGRTSNIVGEYAEYLACRYYGGRPLKISGSSADIETEDGKRYQIKSRKVGVSTTTQLNVIRSWDFDYLVVVLFEQSGKVKQALEVPVEVAKEYCAANSYQNGCVISTTQKFLNDSRSKDITIPLRGAAA